MRLLFILLLLNSLQFTTAESEDGWTRSRKENEMFSRSRRYNDAADRVYDAMIQEYDLPGNDPQQQRDLFLQVFLLIITKTIVVKYSISTGYILGFTMGAYHSGYRLITIIISKVLTTFCLHAAPSRKRIHFRS